MVQAKQPVNGGGVVGYERLAGIVHRLTRPLEPVPTGYPPHLDKVRVRAIIFDIYGTLLISAAGDVGLDSAVDDEEAFLAALTDAGLDRNAWPPDRKATLLLQTAIKDAQARARRQGVNFPEIEIRSIWEEVIASAGGKVDNEQIELLALSYECRINPVWPMPDADFVLDQVRQDGIPMGILSNAQFYTPLLLKEFFGSSPQEVGFDPQLCSWSYRAGEGKPSPGLFNDMQQRLEKRGIEPGDTLYVGNDMLKDIREANRLGWKTALFAGDRRSLRLRSDDERVTGVRPDMVIDNLRQLLDCTIR
jgi:putative hydrolase of the HAD superfamily